MLHHFAYVFDKIQILNQTHKNDEGFSIIETVLIIVIVSIVGCVGWYVFKAMRNTDNAYSTATQISSSHAPKFSHISTKSKVSTTSKTATPYLDITQWGVKIPLSSAISDAYYTTQNSNVGADGLPNTAWLGLSSLNDSGCNISTTGPTSSATPIGSIIRVAPTDKDPVSGDLYTQQDPNGSKVGNYYYAFLPWKNATCASQSTKQSVDSAFADAAKSTRSD